MNPEYTVAIITGSSSGIGAACAVLFAEKGYRITICGRNEERLNKTKLRCIDAGLNVQKIVCVIGDLKESNVRQDIVQSTMEAFNRIDILINNAGGGFPCSISTSTLAEFDELYDRNVRTVLEMTYLCIPYLQVTCGTIVNVSSAAAKTPMPDQVYYCMAKACIDEMTTSLALQLKSIGISVNAVRYRFDKTTCRWLGETFCAELTRDTNRSHPLPAEIMILVALRSYASNSFQQVTGDLFCVAQSTVSKIILEVSDSIVAKADQFIKMPEGPEIRRIQEEFQRKSNIPGVIGAIDCTHVEFIAPKDDAYNYRNRKGKTSINVQAICDDKYKFINILANWPGAAHDSRILKHSQVWTEFEDHGREGILLGDGGYPLRRWLLTPYRFPPDTPAKERYNYKHSSARMVIEQSFGQLKARFHTLKAGLRLRDPKMVKKIIISCCVLHNIGKIQNLPDFDVIDANLEPEGGGGEDDDDDNAGPPQIFRDQIVQNYFNH